MKLRASSTYLLSRSWTRELQWFALAYVLYNASRWIFAGELAPARENALAILEFERSFGADVEAGVQGALDSGVATWLLAHIYLAAQLAVLPGALIWLYRRSRPIYGKLRNTVLATWLLAVPVYAMFPVAPPRLSGVGLEDTVSTHAAVALTGNSTVFYNPYAAVPSLHVGFAFAIGIALASAVSSRRARALALAWGPLVTLAVVATGNHYVADAVAGLAVTAAGYGSALLVARRGLLSRTPLAPWLPRLHLHPRPGAHAK